ncbi:MAG: hypothetical protein E3J88_05160 [Anaerolineales bacterium]|nr:MAG: hypothetical protein E3J88_05160 [Anaerolineales bacterium]
MTKNSFSPSNASMLKIGLFAAFLSIATMSCELDLSRLGFGGGEATPTYTYAPTQISTPVPTIGLQTPTSTTEGIVATVVPTNTSIPSGPSTTASGAACLPGTWAIDHQSVINYMTLSMIGVGEFGFTALGSEGKLELQISPGQVNLLAENFKVKVGVNIGGVASINIFNVSVQANGSANYTASNTSILFTGISYNAVGTMESAITFSMNFDQLLNTAKDLGFAAGVTNPVTTVTLIYTCSGDIMSIVVNPHASVTFHRVIQ